MKKNCICTKFGGFTPLYHAQHDKNQNQWNGNVVRTEYHWAQMLPPLSRTRPYLIDGNYAIVYFHWGIYSNIANNKLER